MTIPSQVLGSGVPALAAQAIVGTTATGLVAVGSNQATSLQLSAGFNVITTSSGSTGVSLPACEAGAFIVIYNLSGQTLQIYTHETTGVTMNAAVAGSTGVQIGNTKTAWCIGTSATTWAVTCSLTST